jgi:hypothetical protein
MSLRLILVDESCSNTTEVVIFTRKYCDSWDVGLFTQNVLDYLTVKFTAQACEEALGKS